MQTNKERRRMDILDAAENVASTASWNGLTMEQVARRAELSRSLVYGCFKDKTQLLFEVAERAFGMLSRRFAGAVSQSGTGIDQLLAVCSAYSAFFREFPIYFEALARCALPSPISGERARMVVTSSEAVCRGFVARALETGIEDGSIRADIGDARLMSAVLWAFMHGAMRFFPAEANVPNRTRVIGPHVAEHAIPMVRRAVQAKPGYA